MKTYLMKKDHPNYELVIKCDTNEEIDKWVYAVTNNNIMEALMRDSLYGQLGTVDGNTEEILTIDFTKVSHKITGFYIDRYDINIKIKVIESKEEEYITKGIDSGLLSFKPRAIIGKNGSIFLVTVDLVAN